MHLQNFFFFQIGPPTYTSRIAGLILYVPNTTSKGDGHLCFHEIQNVACTPPENQRIYSPSNASYFLYYNVHMLEVIYQSYYSECADSELCKVELYGKIECLQQIDNERILRISLRANKVLNMQ